MTETKTIVYFCWPFPPLGGGGISRAVNFSQQIAASEYRLIVVTGNLSQTELARHKVDESRLKELPENMEILRLETKDPSQLKEKLNKLLGERFFSYFKFLIFPLLHTHVTSWSFFNLLKFRSILVKEKPFLFITSSPPHSQLFVGFCLKLLTSSKWLADLRDPYSDGYQWSWPSYFHFKAARLLERLFLSQADQVLVNTPAVGRLYLKRKLVKPERLEVLGNGF